MGRGVSPAWAGSWPEPPPDSRATRPRMAGRSSRRTTRCPWSSRSPGLQATSPATASSAQPDTVVTSFLGTWGENGGRWDGERRNANPTGMTSPLLQAHLHRSGAQRSDPRTESVREEGKVQPEGSAVRRGGGWEGSGVGWECLVGRRGWPWCCPQTGTPPTSRELLLGWEIRMGPPPNRDPFFFCDGGDSHLQGSPLSAGPGWIHAPPSQRGPPAPGFGGAQSCREQGGGCIFPSGAPPSGYGVGSGWDRRRSRGFWGRPPAHLPPHLRSPGSSSRPSRLLYAVLPAG